MAYDSPEPGRAHAAPSATAIGEAAGRPKLGLIACGGALPVRLAETCAAVGRPYHVLAVEGLADPVLEGHPHSKVGLGTIGRTLTILREQACEAICMAGLIQRPDFSALKLDFAGTRLLPRVLMAARGGDDKIFRFLVTYFEEQGFQVEGPDQVMGHLLAPSGPFGRFHPDAEAEKDLALAWDVATRLGDLDVGQGAVAVRGLVLAVEAAEGTDAMLARCAALPDHMRGTPAARAGVLVKRPKPGQELRIDLPTIGVTTVEGADRAGLAGIGVAAHAALIVDREAVIKAADARGLFITGIDRPARSGA